MDRQRLAGDVLLVCLGRVDQRLVAVQRERDPVGDVEAGLLPCELHGADDVAREPLAPQVVVQLELDRDGVRALALDLVALERPHRDE